LFIAFTDAIIYATDADPHRLLHLQMLHWCVFNFAGIFHLAQEIQSS